MHFNFLLTEIVYKEAATNMSPLQPEDDQASCLLLALPLEIKMMVYDYLLISQKPIDCLEHWDGVIVTISVDQHRHPCDVESTILRTCQTIYREALPILYQSNTFVFFDPTCIEQFKNRNLASLGKSIPGAFRQDNVSLVYVLCLLNLQAESLL